MLLSTQSLKFLAAILAIPLYTVNAIDASQIPADTPVSSLVASAKTYLAQGAPSDALTFFDLAISRDPTNYLTIFQRGAAYLSLGRNAQASADFDKVLKLKPDFDGALVQRAKIKARNGEWSAAKDDYTKAGKGSSEEVSQLEEAQGASVLALDAEKKQDWEACVSQAGVAIMTAGTSLWLRQLRARCRFEKGEAREGVNDLAHVLQISPGLVEPHMQMSSEFFYTLGDTDKGVAQVRKCLHADPDSKQCSKLFKREKQLAKVLDKMNAEFEKKHYSKAATLLVGDKETTGLIQDIKEDIAAAKIAGNIHHASQSALYTSLVEQTCQAYREMNSPKRSLPYCKEALELDPNSLHGLLSLAQRQIDSEEFDGAIGTLNKAKDAHSGDQQASNQINRLLNEAHTLLKRSKTKDYYKVLGVDRGADDRTIKRAYRQLTKQHHPDKASAQGISKDDAEKKMASINEAYEVLSDPELKARFDQGEDPNDPTANQGGNPFQGSPFGQGPGGQPVFFRSGGGGGQQHFKFQFGGDGGGGGNPFGGGFPFG